MSLNHGVHSHSFFALAELTIMISWCEVSDSDMPQRKEKKCAKNIARDLNFNEPKLRRLVLRNSWTSFLRHS